MNDRRPALRRPTHPGEMLLEEFLKPLWITRAAFAHQLEVPVQVVNDLVDGRRGITADLACRLARELCTTPDFWLNLQNAVDSWDANATGKR